MNLDRLGSDREAETGATGAILIRAPERLKDELADAAGTPGP
jgi:hypothetical protein